MDEGRPESQVDLSDSESDVDVVEPDPVPVQLTTTAVESLCPPVVAQTRPKEGCGTASPRQLRRGRDVSEITVRTVWWQWITDEYPLLKIQMLLMGYM